MWRAALVFAAIVGCGPKALPPASPDQTITEAMRLVCEAPTRAADDRGEGTRSDKIAGHLSDGVGNNEVLTTVEGWKTDGISKRELDGLLKKAKLRDCKLREEAR
jgi:hypothetical protein